MSYGASVIISGVGYAGIFKWHNNIVSESLPLEIFYQYMFDLNVRITINNSIYVTQRLMKGLSSTCKRKLTRKEESNCKKRKLRKSKHETSIQRLQIHKNVLFAYVDVSQVYKYILFTLIWIHFKIILYRIKPVNLII